MLQDIRTLVTDHLLAARHLAAKAAARFPDHRGITNAHRILNQGRANSSKAHAEPPRDQELEWLRHPPESARGRWVALLGSELVGSAEKLTELIQHLRSRNLESRALVHRVDA